MRRPTSSRNVAVGFVVVALAAPRPSLDDQEPAPRAAVDAAAAPVDGQLIRRGSNCVRLPIMTRLLPAALFDAKLMKFFGLDELR